MSQFQCNRYRLLIPEIKGRSQFMGLMKVNPNHKKYIYRYLYIYIYIYIYIYTQIHIPMHRLNTHICIEIHRNT